MHFLTDIFVAIISGYLALTGMLADSISALLPVETTRPVATQTIVTENSALKRLDSTYADSQSLPDILLKNAAYQNASAIDGVNPTETNETTVEDALVNILCTYKTDTYSRTNTGTGFFVDPQGIIMTNSHIAQFLLLETVQNTGTTTCIVRAGNPAQPLYEAELLYISPAWIQQHAHLISETHPKGTGERDYALLYVTAGLHNAPMPSRFPHLSFDTSPLSMYNKNATITLGGYPAEGMNRTDINTELRPVVAETTITDMFTFTENKADVLLLGESPVGAFGASGGPVLNGDNKVIGLITTKGDDTIDSTTLRALTLSYIDRSMISESTFDLRKTMQGHLSFRAQLFQETIVPFLSRLLESELE